MSYQKDVIFHSLQLKNDRSYSIDDICIRLSSCPRSPVVDRITLSHGHFITVSGRYLSKGHTFHLSSMKVIQHLEVLDFVNASGKKLTGFDSLPHH
jgi:hypothetical protein